MISTAKAIKKTREAQGMTQKELAERCGYTVTDIKAYGLGEKEPKHINLMTIAGALGVTMYEMFERMEEIEEPENLNLDVIRNALSARKAIVETPLDKITVMAFEELIQYKETELTPNQINGMKKNKKKLISWQLNMIIFARNMTNYTERSKCDVSARKRNTIRY